MVTLKMSGVILNFCISRCTRRLIPSPFTFRNPRFPFGLGYRSNESGGFNLVSSGHMSATEFYTIRSFLKQRAVQDHRFICKEAWISLWEIGMGNSDTAYLCSALVPAILFSGGIRYPEIDWKRSIMRHAPEKRENNYVNLLSTYKPFPYRRKRALPRT